MNIILNEYERSSIVHNDFIFPMDYIFQQHILSLFSHIMAFLLESIFLEINIDLSIFFLLQVVYFQCFCVIFVCVSLVYIK